MLKAIVLSRTRRNKAAQLIELYKYNKIRMKICRPKIEGHIFRHPKPNYSINFPRFVDGNVVWMCGIHRFNSFIIIIACLMQNNKIQSSRCRLCCHCHWSLKFMHYELPLLCCIQFCACAKHKIIIIQMRTIRSKQFIWNKSRRARSVFIANAFNNIFHKIYYFQISQPILHVWYIHMRSEKLQEIDLNQWKWRAIYKENLHLQT